MKTKILIKLIATSLFILTLTFTVSAQTQKRYGGSFAKGVELFYAKNYAGAAKEFEKAEAENPGNHAAYLWHGLAYTQLDKIYGKPATIWQNMPWDDKAKNMYRFFMGLGYWQSGDTSSAKYWFKATFDYKETPAYELAQAALKALLEDSEVPPFEMWASFASLPGAKSLDDFDEEDEPEETTFGTSAVNTRPQTPAPQNPQPQTSGTKPSAGLWKATISNGYKGQTLTFRVSADGGTISEVTFKGYLQCRGSRIEDTQLAPLRNVAISGGSFNDTQLNGGAKVRFDFDGTFKSATTASGNYRVMSDTDCDTYKLNWTATRVGN